MNVKDNKDLQVPADVNLIAIENALVKRDRKVTTKSIANLNHLFQECETSLSIEYGIIEQTFSPTALDEISKWILVHVK
ncbi:hypothetical protein [Flavobacterium sp. 1]|uniref:hypothetical protein n=1 Tax=Flavobacterium sp. 1 TaxID=2035200 RepID=UPI000C231DA3|nr:hypothetical protein [Flavobacterium sp. 1]